MNASKFLHVFCTVLTASFLTTLVSRAAEAYVPPQPPKVIQPVTLPPNVDRDVVRLRLVIDKNGHAKKISVLSLCDQVLEMRLVPAVEKWQFTPATENGRPVEAEVILPLRLVDLSTSRGNRL